MSWIYKFKKEIEDLQLEKAILTPEEQKSASNDRFAQMKLILNTALARQDSVEERLSEGLKEFVADYMGRKKLSANILQSFRVIVDKCTGISDDLLDSGSLQSFNDSTAYTQQELDDLRAMQQTLSDAIMALEQKQDVSKAAEEEKGILQKVASLIEAKIFGDNPASESNPNLIKNIHKLKQEIALSTPIEETAVQKAIGSIPKLGFFEMIQNGFCKAFLGRTSKVAQSRENLITRIKALHKSTSEVQQNAQKHLDDLAGTLKAANENVERRIRKIETHQDQFNRKKDSSLAVLGTAAKSAADLLALKPKKETKINENLKASKRHLDAIEQELLSIRVIEERKKSIDLPIDPAQERIDAMMAEMFEPVDEPTSNPQEIMVEAIDLEQQEIDRILDDIDTSLVEVSGVSRSMTSSAKLSELVEESKELSKDIASSYRAARVSHNSIKALQKKSSDSHKEVLKLTKEIEEMKPSRVGAKRLASIEGKAKAVELRDSAQRQLEKQERNVDEANIRESELEEKRAKTSELLLKCKKRHLTALSELFEQKMAHCDSLIAANEARLKELPEALALEPIQANDSEFGSFPDIYAANLKESGLSGEIKQALDKSKKAHEKVLGLRKAYENEMRKHQAAITDPERSFWEAAKETFSGFVQGKPEQEVEHSTEIERIDDAIGIEKKRLEDLEVFHRSILAHNGNAERLESKKVAFQQAYVEAKKEIAVLNSLVGQAEHEELRQKSIEKSLQGVVASANMATDADKESILETVAVTVKNIVNPAPEVTPMMSEEDLAKEIRREANDSLKAVEGLVAECAALSDEIAYCRNQGYDKFKHGGGESKVHQLKEKATALMQEMHSHSRKGELELVLVQTLVSASSALQHAVNAALLNIILATPTLEDPADVRVEMIQEAEMWAKQAEEWLSAQEEALSEDGDEMVSLHRLVKVQNWLEVQRKNHELLMQHQTLSSKGKELILSEKALYEESRYLLNTTEEVIAQHESAKEALSKYKENIEQAKAHKMDAVVLEEAKPAIEINPVGAMVAESKPSVLVGNRHALFGSTAPQKAHQDEPRSLVRRTLLGKAMAALSAFVLNATAWFGSAVESVGIGFL